MGGEAEGQNRPATSVTPDSERTVVKREARTVQINKSVFGLSHRDRCQCWDLDRVSTCHQNENGKVWM